MAPKSHGFILTIAVLCVLVGLTLWMRARHAAATEAFQNASAPPAKSTVCLLCVCPDEGVVAFAEKMAELYDMYIVCDNVGCKVSDSSPVHFLRIKDEDARSAGYHSVNASIPKNPSAWDKALYYFCEVEQRPQHVWFVEEDVFVPRPGIFKDLNAKYPDTDFITKQHVSQDEDPEFYWWYQAEGNMKKPYYRSLVCASRLSRRLLNEVKDFVHEKHRLFYLEVIFSTMVEQKKMSLVMPDELQTIIFRHDWNADTVDEEHLYHPVKDVKLHDSYRERLASKAER
jgi:hypothetical protein